MSRCKTLLFIITAMVSLCFSINLCAQITDPEGEYGRIRAAAFNGNYGEASLAARKLLREYPDYGDARILLGRILAWDKQYGEAAAVIDTLLIKEPENIDARKARLDVAFWSGDNALAEKLAFSLLSDTPSDTEVREKLIKVLLADGKREQALAHSDTLLQHNPDNSFAIAVREPYPDIKKTDNLRLSYSFDSYTKPYTRLWQQLSLFGGHRFKWGMAGAGVNIGHINIGDPAPVTETDLQYEIEVAPTLSPKNYAFLSYAYSAGTYYPGHRASLEVWQILPAGWATSAGLTYFHFDRDIFIAGLSVEKYLGNYWFSGKAYFYFKDFGTTTSFYLNARKYFNDTDYLQFTVGAGTAPDEPFDIQTSESRLSAYSLRTTYYQLLNRRFAIRLNAGYSREEYQDNSYRNRIEGAVGVIYLLKQK